jgi:serine/threonine-protein kinase
MKFCPTCNTKFEESLSYCPRDGEVLQESPENLVGQSLDGKYEIESFIAQGGMGAVYRARHILLGDRVVIKILRSEMRQNTEWLRRFQREGRAARSFRHPNAVTVYDMSAGGDGLIYMVMEYVEGRTLDSELKHRKRLTPLEALEVLEPVADALDAAHARGVVHRDMKPENVMLGVGDHGEKVVKLLDLGIAKLVGVADSVGGDATSLTVAGQILGTPFYMSPEQWGELPRDGNSEVDGRTDIYSLGVIFFELVAGRKPHGGRTFSELRNEHVRGNVDLRQVAPDAPEAFAQAVQHAMAKDRNDRPQTAGQLIDEVRESLGLHVRARSRITKSDEELTSISSRAVASSLPRGSEEANTARLPGNQTSEKGELGRADTIRTADLVSPAPSDEKATSALSGHPGTNANVVARGDAGRVTSVGHSPSALEADVARPSDVASPPVHPPAITPRRKRSSLPFVAAGGALALLVVLVAGGWVAWKVTHRDNTDLSKGNGAERSTPVAKVEAMSYWIEAFDVPAEGDIRRVAETTAPLASGQHFKFHFIAPERGYLYMIGPGKEGNALMTFLTAQGGGLLKTNLIAANADYPFPFGEDKVLVLDDNPGTEEYTVLFSTTPLMSPAFLTEKYLKELSPAEVKEFEDFRTQNRTAAVTLDVNQKDGDRRVVVSVPEDAKGRPIVFDIRIKHEK